MKELTMYQYSVKPGEKAILNARIVGNAIVQAGAPMVLTGQDTWECTVAAANVTFKVLVTFPDLTPGSQVDITIDGELNGKQGDGPFRVFRIYPTSSIKDPNFVLAVR